MSEQYATASCLSCLLDSRRELEPVPEPFRMQQDMVFRVTLTTYTEYVLSKDSNSARLMSQVGLLKRLASTGSPRLYNYFLRDMAFALLKEISYAEEYSMAATAILPASRNSNVVKASYVLGLYAGSLYDIEMALREHLATLNYTLPRRISAVNSNLFTLALIFYKLSTSKSIVKEMHFLYDTIK